MTFTKIIISFLIGISLFLLGIGEFYKNKKK